MTVSTPTETAIQMAFHNEVGLWGEQMACDYLVSQGYALMERNAKIHRIEIDIIACKADAICFVEVKTRSSDETDPVYAVDDRKMKRMCRAANDYINSHDLHLTPQIDIITVIGDPLSGIRRIEHYPDCYLPTPVTAKIG